MSQAFVVHGRYIGRTFIPDGPLPDTEGTAELVITPSTRQSGSSIADVFGTAAQLRSAAEILTEVRTERDQWGDRWVYLDSNVVIRLVEGDAATRSPLVTRLAASLGVPASLGTSRLTRLECRSKPLSAGDVTTLKQFEMFFAGIELVIVEMNAAVVERATEFRAKYNLKTPDALHYASALELGAGVFLTGDRTFSRCSEVTVEIL